METVLITGGLGQAGLALTARLQTLSPAPQIHVLDLRTPSPTDFRFSPNVIYHVGDITSRANISAILNEVKPDTVFHTAGLIPHIAEKLGMNNEESFMRVNVEGTRVMLDESKEVGVRAFVFTSSCDVVKGNSWGNLDGVDESFEIPEVFDGAYAKSKVRSLYLPTMRFK